MSFDNGSTPRFTTRIEIQGLLKMKQQIFNICWLHKTEFWKTHRESFSLVFLRIIHRLQQELETWFIQRINYRFARFFPNHSWVERGRAERETEKHFSCHRTKKAFPGAFLMGDTDGGDDDYMVFGAITLQAWVDMSSSSHHHKKQSSTE